MASKIQRNNVPGSNTGCVYDAQLKLLFRNREYVADICNAVIYDGVKFVTPKMLEPRPVEQNVVLAKSNGGFETDNRSRDLAFFVRCGDNGEGFLLCLEVQCSQDNIMPLRVLEYNTRELVGLGKEQDYQKKHKLPLVVTLVLNFSEGHWKAPRSLWEMAIYRDAKVEQASEQGKIIVVDPHAMDDKMLGMYCKDLKFVLSCFRASKDVSSLDAWLEDVAELEQMPFEILRLLELFFDVKVNKYKKSNRTTWRMKDMCEAFKIKCEHYYNNGRNEEKENIAANALRMKLSFNDIRKLTGLPLKKIRSIAASVATV